MIKFNIGDKVRITKLDNPDVIIYPNVKVGDTGVVLEESIVPHLRLDEPNGNGGGECEDLCEDNHAACFRQERLELIKSK